jgi:glycosyltransferase involved in cell wall biosynthesis
MRFYFWQQVLSPHQNEFIIELSKITGNKIFWIVESEKLEYRTNMGWEDVNVTDLNIIIAPTKNQIHQIIDESKIYNSIHVFSGLRGVWLVRYALKYACKFDLKIAIQSESIDKKGLKGIVRIFLGLLDRIRFSSKISYIFAIGSTGRNWFEFLGYKKNIIFDWGYFPDSKFLEFDNVEYDTSKFNFIYCGSLINEKGIVNLIKAFCNIVKFHPKTHLHLVGSGKNMDDIITMTNKYKLSKNVSFHGVLLNKQAKYLISKSDVLILPSIRKDGWGAVVNEAILNGTKVICSDLCGASIVIKNNRVFGRVFDHRKIETLIQSMNELLDEGKISFEMRNVLIEKSKILKPRTASIYFNSIVNNLLTIKAPWVS